ncbi:MAG TPA: universal stress protein [Propionibacteriaceae bacterium]|jgi:nucleotide-binding universal stress UspA family protein|nr:universal stress protein [Propionibacteriaceae bacterium]
MALQEGERRNARSIVVGTDGSEPADEAVRQATDMASREGARLHLVTAYPDPQILRERTTGTGGGAYTIIDLRDVAESLVQRAARDALRKSVEVETHVREGQPAEVIIDVANQEQADLIVVGSRGLTGIKRYLLGSVSSKVSEHAPCSVMIVRAT